MTGTLQARAREILAANDRGGFTVPTHGLYPFQWNWDSAFVAMGFATYDLDRAIRELERLVEGQWDDGMIPHIVFHQDSDTYFPGPAVWGTRHRIATSGITQPPVFALALERIAALAPTGAEPRLAALYAAALRNHRWWAAARDPEGTGLVAVLHNWETGRDNSPEWDDPFRRVPDRATTPIRRRDTGHVDAAMRPTDQDYRRYIHLVDTYRELGWEPTALWKAAPFKVVDIGINAILLAAEEALGRLAMRFGAAGDLDEIEARVRSKSAALRGLWREPHGHFHSLDLIDGSTLAAQVSAGFLPLLTGAPTPEQCSRLGARLDQLTATCRLAVPSTLPDQPGFEPKRYWRGPVWAVVNWMIARGLERHGAEAVAGRLDRMTLAAIAENGFAEYFDPTTGQGLGGAAFSWTAAIALMLIDAGVPVEAAST